MNRTQRTNIDLNERLSVSDETLAALLDCGLVSARRIAEDANAVFFIGRRKLNNVVKIQRYINKITNKKNNKEGDVEDGRE